MTDMNILDLFLKASLLVKLIMLISVSYTHLGDAFEKRHGIRLGFMSFYVKAVVEALKRYPEEMCIRDRNFPERPDLCAAL